MNPGLLRELRRARLDVSHVRRLSRAGSADSWRVDLVGGACLKARVYRERRAAAQVWGLLQLPGPGTLPRPLLVSGRILLVEFVEGGCLAARARRGELAGFVPAAGALLARLHHTPIPPSAARTARPVSNRLIVRATAALVRRRLMDRAVAARLGEFPVPRRPPVTLTHGDLCPENLVVTADGRLRAIDEERLAVRAAEYDLARTIVRWPLAAGAEARFLRAYGRAGGDAAAFGSFRPYWVAMALSTSIDYRLRQGLPGVARLVQALARLSA